MAEAAADTDGRLNPAPGALDAPADDVFDGHAHLPPTEASDQQIVVKSDPRAFGCDAEREAKQQGQRAPSRIG